MDRRNLRILMLAIAAVIAIAGGLAYEITATRPVREGLRTFAELITVANQPGLTEAGRLEAAGRLCTRNYLASHPLALAPEGGIAGLPRSISINFQAWREGPNIWLCPRNRIGPVYQLVPQDGRWLFDGLIGYLRPRGEFVRASDFPDPELTP